MDTTDPHKTTDTTTAAPPAVSAARMKVRLLADCAHGKANEVVLLAKADAETAVAGGVADAAKAAVAYAESLVKRAVEQ